MSHCKECVILFERAWKSRKRVCQIKSEFILRDRGRCARAACACVKDPLTKSAQRHQFRGNTCWWWGSSHMFTCPGWNQGWNGQNGPRHLFICFRPSYVSTGIFQHCLQQIRCIETETEKEKGGTDPAAHHPAQYRLCGWSCRCRVQLSWYKSKSSN